MMFIVQNDDAQLVVSKTNAIRVFHITTNPCVADPAWLIKCWEDVDATHVNQFYDYEEIKSLISDCETKQIKAVGRAEEFERILKMFGASGYKELIEMAERCKAQKEAV
jgi:hypothetical protein